MCTPNLTRKVRGALVSRRPTLKNKWVWGNSIQKKFGGTGIQGRRKQLLIGPAKGMAVKEKHANARGSGGMPPQEIFEKTCSEIASDSFHSQTELTSP